MMEEGVVKQAVPAVLLDYVDMCMRKRIERPSSIWKALTVMLAMDAGIIRFLLSIIFFVVYSQNRAVGLCVSL